MDQIYKIYTSETTTDRERSFFKWILFPYALMQFADNGYPFYFMRPIFECQDQNGIYQTCLQNDACSNKFVYKLSEQSPKSLSYYYNITCENEYIKAQCITLMFTIGLMGTLILIMHKIKNNRNFHVYITSCHIIFLILFQFQTNAYTKSLFLGLSFNFLNVTMVSNAWIMTNSELEQQMKSTFGSANGVVFGFVGILIPFGIYLLNSNIDQVMMIVVILQAFMLYQFSNSIPDDKADSHNNTKEEIQDETEEIIKQYPHILTNAYIQIFENVMTYFVMVYLAVEMQVYGGNIYINMAVFELCELLGNFLSMKVTMSKNVVQYKIYMLVIIVVLQILFIFKDSQSSHPLFLLMIFFIKFMGESLFTINACLVFDYFPIEVLQKLFGISGLIVRMSLIFIPYSIYCIKTYLGLNPLFIFGLVNAVVLYLQKFKIKIDHQNDEFEECNPIEANRSISMKYLSMSMRPMSILQQIEKINNINQVAQSEKSSLVSNQRISRVSNSRFSQQRKFSKQEFK